MKLTFQETIQKLNEFWTNQGCALLQSHDTEVGAGTLHPGTLLGALVHDEYRACYTQTSTRPKDARFGVGLNRVYAHHQYQVIVKSKSLEDPTIQNLFLSSLSHIGVDFHKNDIRFIEDNWKNPSVGAYGLGWEVWYNGTEITQFTYMQKLGGIKLDIIPTEITYGLERLVLCIQGVNAVSDIQYSKDKTYGDLFANNEMEMSRSCLVEADIDLNKRHLEDNLSEATRFLGQKLPRVAYSHIIKGSHLLNILDARKALSYNDKFSLMLRLRELVKQVCAQLLKIKALSRNLS